MVLLAGARPKGAHRLAGHSVDQRKNVVAFSMLEICDAFCGSKEKRVCFFYVGDIDARD